MSWDTAVVDIRTLLDEGAEDKLIYRKRCLGECNGVNTFFKTFDNRRLTDFTNVEFPLGVWLSGVLQDSSAVSEDVLDSGDFILAEAPADGSVVEASYYCRWFLDTELTQFLASASQWLALGSDFTKVAEPLRPGALKYAASDAYQKLVIRWARRLSEGYMLNDAPATEEVGKMIAQYTDIAMKYREDAQKIRDDYYSRSGTQLSPAWSFALGRVIDNVPKE